MVCVVSALVFFCSPVQKHWLKANVFFSTFCLIFICLVLPETWNEEKINLLKEYSCTQQIVILMKAAIVSGQFNFSFGHTIFLFGWICTNIWVYIAIGFLFSHIAPSHNWFIFQVNIRYMVFYLVELNQKQSYITSDFQLSQNLNYPLAISSNTVSLLFMLLGLKKSPVGCKLDGLFTTKNKDNFILLWLNCKKLKKYFRF